MLARCNNLAVISIVNNSGQSEDKEVMHLARCLTFIGAMIDLHFMATHIKGVDNMLADAFSRDNLTLLRSLYPQANQTPTVIPEELLDLAMLS